MRPSPQIHRGNGQSNADDLHGFYLKAIKPPLSTLTCASHLRKLMKSCSRVCNERSGVRHWTDVLANNPTRGGEGVVLCDANDAVRYMSLPEIRNGDFFQ